MMLTRQFERRRNMFPLLMLILYIVQLRVFGGQNKGVYCVVVK